MSKAGQNPIPILTTEHVQTGSLHSFHELPRQNQRQSSIYFPLLISNFQFHSFLHFDFFFHLFDIRSELSFCLLPKARNGGVAEADQAIGKFLHLTFQNNDDTSYGQSYCDNGRIKRRGSTGKRKEKGKEKGKESTA